MPENETQSIPSKDSSTESKQEVELNAELSAITALAAIKASPAVAKKFAQALTKQPSFQGLVYRTRPKGPYYNKIRALELKPILDDFILTGKPVCFFTRNFQRATIDTLYNRIHQSFLYLIEDADMIEAYGTKYQELRMIVSIAKMDKKTAKECICIQYKKDIESKVEPLVATTGTTTTGSYQSKIDEFLNDADSPEYLIINNVHLSSEEMETLDISLSSLAGIFAHVEQHRIKITKFKEKE